VLLSQGGEVLGALDHLLAVHRAHRHGGPHQVHIDIDAAVVDFLIDDPQAALILGRRPGEGLLVYPALRLDVVDAILLEERPVGWGGIRCPAGRGILLGRLAGLAELVDQAPAVFHLGLVRRYAERLAGLLQFAGEADRETLHHDTTEVLGARALISFGQFIPDDYPLKVRIPSGDLTTIQGHLQIEGHLLSLGGEPQLHGAIVDRVGRHEYLGALMRGVPVGADLGDVQVAVGFKIEVSQAHGIARQRKTSIPNTANAPPENISDTAT